MRWQERQERNNQGRVLRRTSPERLSKMDLYSAATTFMRWLDEQVLFCARGDLLDNLEVEPNGRFWLGRLAPEESVSESALGERGERLEPCAIGARLRTDGVFPRSFTVTVRARVWIFNGEVWKKLPPLQDPFDIYIEDAQPSERSFGREALTNSLTTICGAEGLSCEVRIELRDDADGTPELTVLLVNTSPSEHQGFRDTNLYECSIEIAGLEPIPFILESLPDSFRYDRRVLAYGINCGVELTEHGSLQTVDAVAVEKDRPSYWSVSEPLPNLTFSGLSENPIPHLKQLVAAHAMWGVHAWGEKIGARAQEETWSPSMLAEAECAAREFGVESERMTEGIRLLESDPRLLKAFKLMNRALSHAAGGRYDSWRPFQVGFLLANLASVAREDNSANVADVVWFATGGGKTETYLGLLVTAALHDRSRGKLTGITAWSRFPLRMLSLQQTQRFADALAGAEIVRRQGGLPGDPFSVGFLVGQGGTPNSLKEEAGSGEPDVDDDEMPGRYRVLLTCPFCRSEDIAMAFDRRLWRLEHRCLNDACAWPERALPFFIIDDEIYRFLPTVIVGTLDKAATIAMQTGMRGLVGPPFGLCSQEGHGHTYAPRSNRPTGCLVPGCRGKRQPLLMNNDLYAPSFRLQDELHLLKDSLGAVDSHYESLLDHLEERISGRKPKILASSATLTGYDRQIQLLYQREGRVFPVPGPSFDEGFWTNSGDKVARRYVAVAPRGVTIEYAVDRTVTEVQRIVRALDKDPAAVCKAAGIDPSFAADLLSLYGVNVVYGNTIRDLEAVARSLETQIDVEGLVNTASLTGKTDFEEVRVILGRLQNPEEDLDARLHVVTASSMMSHGVDIDRLNIMVMLGIPLGAAEFIQTTARVGRAWPGVVYVMHKIARERDASVFRCFDKFVLQGDRFVEPIPITRRSRKVLEKTVAGLFLARVLHIHEAQSALALTTVSNLRRYFSGAGIGEEAELSEMIAMLKFDSGLDDALRNDLQRWLERFFSSLNNPGGTFRFPWELSPTGRPMRSLRDVEEEAPVLGY